MSNLIELPQNHYCVPVTYAPMPSRADLEKEFGKKNVSIIFDGREWKLHSSCVGMSRMPGDRIFCVHEVEHYRVREEVIAWGLTERTVITPYGLRSAIHEETYEFSKAHPELADYVSLGSSALHDDGECVAIVWFNGRQRTLDRCRIDDLFMIRGSLALFVAITEDDLRGRAAG
ncbi:MAG: hypothetical protein PHS79_04240 [Patescibacteria group bacterium]|nr:hypothetical protein [Patescibacteria group bacterium]